MVLPILQIFTIRNRHLPELSWAEVGGSIEFEIGKEFFQELEDSFL